MGRGNHDVPYCKRGAAERALGVCFHQDYRRFLLEASDVTFGALEAAQVTPDAERLYLVDMADEAHESMDLPERLLPICEDNGDYYCMRASGKSSEVIYWSHDGSTDERWPDLDAWIAEVWIGENG
ncbi:MAG: SMI1/KNR4 family protein [Chloroflexi bacterium]|nr:SMI1/KNR4 family protein [Chloroflexota bacterium]